MQFNCVAHITYEFTIEADSAEEAEISAFELLADDVTEGTIRTDLFDNGEGAGLRFPMLDSVDVVAADTIIYKEGGGNDGESD